MLIASGSGGRRGGFWACRSVSVLADHLKSRQGQTPDLGIPTNGSVEFPREIPGLDIDLNWSLAKDVVTPKSLAFRNLKVSDLQKKALGTTESEALVVSGIGALSQAPDVFVIDGSPQLKGVRDHAVTRPQFNRALRLVSEHLSSLPEVFVEDGAIGSAGGLTRGEVVTRCIADNATTSLSWKNMLCRAVMRPPLQFEHPLTVYLAPAFDAFADLESVGVTSRNLVVVNPERGIVLCLGPAAALPGSTIRSAVFQAAASIAQRQGSAAVALEGADLLQFNNGGTLSVVVDAGDILQSSPSLCSSGGVLLTSQGLARGFGGVHKSQGKSSANSMAKGVVVDQTSKTVFSRTALPSLAVAPKTIIFVSKDGLGQSTAVGKIGSEADLLQVLLGRNSFPLARDPKAIAKGVWEFASTSGANIFLVNSSSSELNGDADKVRELVESIGSESKKRFKSSSPSAPESRRQQYQTWFPEPEAKPAAN